MVVGREGGGRGGEGGGGKLTHDSLLHTNIQSYSQPVEQHVPGPSSLGVHNLPPCAAHSAVASSCVTELPSKEPVMTPTARLELNS
eukprot:4020549-Prymnesium_polylepis.2